jgi:hypothetical protein
LIVGDTFCHPLSEPFEYRRRSGVACSGSQKEQKIAGIDAATGSWLVEAVRMGTRIHPTGRVSKRTR